MLSSLRLIIVLLVTAGGLAVSYRAGVPLAAGFSFGLLTLLYYVRKAGFGKKVIIRGMKNGVIHTKEVVIILLLVGLLIPAWTASGTIPYLIDTGLSLLNPSYFVTSCFLFTSVISMMLGTSTGTLSAVGIPLIGMAVYLHVPLAMAGGALISGAMLGDRTSPFSSAHQLVAASTGVSVKEQGKALLPTTIGAVIFAALTFLFLDLFVLGTREETAAGVTEAYSRSFTYSPLLWIPPLLLVGSIFFRLKTRHAFMAGIAASLVLGTALQNVSWSEWLYYLWSGYVSPEHPELHGKGIAGMLDLVLLIVLAGAFNGIVEESGILSPYIRQMFAGTASLSSSTLRVIAFGFGMCLVSCTQTLPIMMSGRMLLPIWSERFDKGQLSRVVADSGVVFAAMVPWNMLAILCSTIINVPVETYLPYAVLLWILPPLTAAASLLMDRKSVSRSAV